MKYAAKRDRVEIGIIVNMYRIIELDEVVATHRPVDCQGNRDEEECDETVAVHGHP